MFTEAMSLLFKGDKMEARIQRRYMEQGRYDLCIDQGAQVFPIDGQRDWSRVEPGTRVVMRAILFQQRPIGTRRHQCPRCKTWNDSRGVKEDSSQNLSIDWSAVLSPLRVWKSDSIKAEDVTAGSRLLRDMIIQIRRTTRTEVPERMRIARHTTQKWGYLSTFTWRIIIRYVAYEGVEVLAIINKTTNIFVSDGA